MSPGLLLTFLNRHIPENLYTYDLFSICMQYANLLLGHEISPELVALRSFILREVYIICVLTQHSTVCFKTKLMFRNCNKLIF